MKKVLFVATVVKQHIMTFHIPCLKLFKENGWETAVAAYNDYDDKSECSIPYCDNYFDISFERNPFSRKNIRAYRELKKIINSEQYDIIHCHTPVGGFLARMAARKTRKSMTKVIYTAHGFHFYKKAPLKNWLLYFPIEWFCSWFTDTLITINKEDYSLAKKFHSKKLFYVPGVGVKVESENNEEIKSEFVSSLNSNGEIVILSVGELNANKNHATVLKALSSLDLNYKYIICGQGDLRNYLEELASKLCISDKVVFAGYRNDIDKILANTDIFCFPSIREGLSLALMEAVSFGVPCVVSKARGNSDLVVDGLNGYVCDTMEPSEYAIAIQRLANDLQLRKQMGKNCKKIIQTYSIDNVLNCMKKIYFE